jgi:plasmid stability protein
VSASVKQLLVRNVEVEVVRALKLRAARNGTSAEEEHRRILREALARPTHTPSLRDVILEMPDAGDDKDFARSDDRGRPVDL